MPGLYFTGVVLPERDRLDVANVPSAQVIRDDSTVHATITLSIQANQISAFVLSDDPEVGTLRNMVRSEAEFVVNVAGFILGKAWDVEITKCSSEALTNSVVFSLEVPMLRERVIGRDINALAQEIFPLCYGESAIYLRRCLHDLSFAIRRPEDTAFYCYRAIESLRHSFGSELSETEQWKAMGAAVGASKESMDHLRSHAFPARHGRPVILTEPDRLQMFSYTWNVVERYIDHRLSEENGKSIFSVGGKS